MSCPLPEPLRLRSIGDRFELTKKIGVSPQDFSRQEELTIPLTAEEYGKLRPLSTRGLDKTRYYFPLAQGLTAEIDIFSGPLQGLVMVEVEFPDEEARQSFKPPAWFGKDISQELWATNAWLAGRAFSEVEPFLKE